MGAPPYALSISHFVSSVGADAGFAAIVGLAILILLYFAQARETASLRDRFSEAAEQVRQLELRVAQLSRPTAGNTAVPSVAPRPAAATAAPVASRPAGRTPLPVSAVPMAPAGVGAPALSAATRLVPSGDEGAISIRSGRARVAAAAEGAGAAVATAGSDEAQGSGGGGVIAPPAPAGPPAPDGPAPAAGPAPATAAGGATGRATGGTPPPARAGNGVANGTGQTRPPVPAAGQPRSAQASGRPYRIAGDRPTGAPRRPLIEPAPPAGGSWARRGLMALVGLLLLGAIVAVLLVVTSNNGSSTQARSSSTASKAPSTKKQRHTRTPALTPAQVTVAVLNGTSTTNLAHDVSLRLTNAGYKPGTIATATDQTQTATTVGYLPGQRRSAQIVARSLNLGSTAIQPVTQSNQAVACPQSTGCPAQVVVTVGSDLASAASTSQAVSSTTT